MRSLRHAATALAAVAAAAALAACGSAPAPAAAGTNAARSTTTATASPDAATASPSTTTAAGWPRHPGTDPKVLSAKPTVKTGPQSQFFLDPAQQRSAAAFADDLMHRSHLNFSQLPHQQTPQQFTGDMTPKRHAGYAAAVKSGKSSFGLTFTADEQAGMRATAVSQYTITAKRDFLERDYEEGITFLVRSVVDYDIYAGTAKNTEDLKARQIVNVTLAVVPGQDGKHRWQLAAWNYEGGPSWQYKNPAGDWVRWG